MLPIKIIRLRIARLLKDTEALPPLENLPAMDPAAQADAMTTAWDLRQRAYVLSRILNDDSRSAPENSSYAEVTHACFDLFVHLKRYDCCAVDLLSLTKRPIPVCAAELQSAVDALDVEDSVSRLLSPDKADQSGSL